MKRSAKLRLIAILSLAVMATLFSSRMSHAQTWDGGGADNDWQTDANWDTNVQPVNDGTANIIFGGITRLTPNTDVAYNVRTIVFNSTAGTFVNAGSQLTIQAGVTNNSTNLETINNDIVLGAAQSFNAASGNLAFGGAINQGANLLTFNGSHDIALSGAITGSGGLTVNMGGATNVVTLSGNNSPSGTVTVTQGILRSGAANGLPGNVAYVINGGTVDLANNPLTVSSLSGSGGTITLGSAALTDNQSGNTTYSGIISGTGSLVKQGTGNLTLAGANVYSGGTTVTAGTLTGTTTSLQGAITNNATVTFDQSTTGTYAGAITGTGVVNKNGTGTVILTGNNDYSGGTNVTQGTLQGDTTSLKHDIVVSSLANVTFNQAIVSNTYAGVISGAGSVTKTGINAVTITAPQTYTGGTNINQGSLILGNSNVLTDAGAVNISGGTLDIADKTDTVGVVTLTSGTIAGTTGALTGSSYAVQSGTINGTLTGGGALTKTGAGTVTIQKAQTYTGGTNVNAGTLALGASNVLEDASAVNINGGTLDIGANTDSVGIVTLQSGSITGTGVGKLTGTSYAVQSGTISANLDGSGALTKTMTGTVTLAGNNTTIGAAAINAGRLDVTGTTTTPTATVASGGTLGGTGHIVGAVVNGGTVSAGTSSTPIADLQVTSYSTDGGTTNVNITTSNSSVLNVDANANLTGGTVNVNAASGKYNAGQKFTFMTFTTRKDGTNDTTFDDITDNIAGLDAVLGYDNGSAFFTLLRNGKTYEAVGRTQNQRAVGAYLDRISPTATGDLQTVFDGINSISDAEARIAFDQLGGASHATLAQIGVQNTTLVIGQVSSRLRAMPYAAGTAGGGKTGSFAPDMMDLGSTRAEKPESPVTLVSCGPDGCGEQVYGLNECGDCDGGGDCCCSCRKTNWQGWTQGYGLGGAAKSDGNAQGFNYSMGGVVGGIERWVDDHQLVGWWGGYVGSNVVIDGDQKINGGQFGAYIFTQHDNSYTTWLAGAEFDGYSTRRHLDFDGIDRFASADSDGWQAFGYWERGLSMESCTETFQPFVALQYVFLRQGEFSETGANSVDLNAGGTDTNSLRSELGARLQHVFYNHNGRRSLPEVHAMWLHEFLDTNTVLNASFAGGGGATGFAVQGLDLGRDWALVGCNWTWEMHDCWSMFVNYDCQTNTQQTFHIGSGGIGHMW
jgi:autotransporter-associated beta strand protein